MCVTKPACECKDLRAYQIPELLPSSRLQTHLILFTAGPILLISTSFTPSLVRLMRAILCTAPSSQMRSHIRFDATSSLLYDDDDTHSIEQDGAAVRSGMVSGMYRIGLSQACCTWLKRIVVRDSGWRETYVARLNRRDSGRFQQVMHCHGPIVTRNGPWYHNA